MQQFTVKFFIKTVAVVGKGEFNQMFGAGSVGTRCWIIFLAGNHSDDPLFLQVKEAQPSVLETFINKSSYANRGECIVAGQRLIQGAPDIFLSWGERNGIHFYVRCCGI